MNHIKYNGSYGCSIITPREAKNSDRVGTNRLNRSLLLDINRDIPIRIDRMSSPYRISVSEYH